LGISKLDPEQIQQFEQDGYLILENQFSKSEVEHILDVAKQDPILAGRSKTNRNFEGDGLETRLVNHANLEDDLYSAYVQSHRIVGPMEQLLESKACHFYHLTMMKDTNTGGWQWHQDYGYHYKEFFYPNYISAMVALDPATKENGCLRVVRASHKLGRLEHWKSGSQLIADPARVAIALEHMEEIHCELEPGSVLLFHGNTLHASDVNLSSQSRWSFVIGYVAASNIITLPDAPPDLLEPIEVLDDAGVAARAKKYIESLQMA